MGNDKWHGAAVFKYPEVLYNHYQHRDSVNAHNALRMYPIAIKEAWKTHRWALRVFQFLVAVSEIIVKLGLEKIYNNPQLTQMESRKLLAHQLIYNHYLEQESSSIRRARNLYDDPNTHQLISLPPFTNFCGTQIVKTKTRCA